MRPLSAGAVNCVVVVIVGGGVGGVGAAASSRKLDVSLSSFSSVLRSLTLGSAVSQLTPEGRTHLAFAIKHTWGKNVN